MSITAHKPLTIVVLASGEGTLFQYLVDAYTSSSPQSEPSVRIAALVTDKECPALDRAEAASIPARCVELPATGNSAAASAEQSAETREQRRRMWNTQLASVVNEYQPDLVVSAGFMRIVSGDFLQAIGFRMINTHPALLPAFPGAHAVEEALAYGVKQTGTTIHLVDTGVDTGPILAQAAVPVKNEDTVSTLHERIKTVERELLLATINDIATYGLTTDGRKAQINV